MLLQKRGKFVGFYWNLQIFHVQTGASLYENSHGKCITCMFDLFTRSDILTWILFTSIMGILDERPWLKSEISPSRCFWQITRMYRPPSVITYKQLPIIICIYTINFCMLYHLYTYEKLYTLQIPQLVSAWVNGCVATLPFRREKISLLCNLFADLFLRVFLL